MNREILKIKKNHLKTYFDGNETRMFGSTNIGNESRYKLIDGLYIHWKRLLNYTFVFTNCSI